MGAVREQALPGRSQPPVSPVLTPRTAATRCVRLEQTMTHAQTRLAPTYLPAEMIEVVVSCMASITKAFINGSASAARPSCHKLESMEVARALNVSKVTHTVHFHSNVTYEEHGLRIDRYSSRYTDSATSSQPWTDASQTRCLGLRHAAENHCHRKR